jgi:uncharacterized protein (DUF58 family)
MKSTVADILSPSTLARIENYALLARVAVEGFISGMHRSLSHGTGSEFLQYRNYSFGDDLKYVDWKAFARLDRYLTKVFLEETNTACRIVLDASASLDYRGDRASVTKWRYACMTAACIAYLASRQGDNVGLYIYNEGMTDVLEPSGTRGQLQRVFHSMARQKPTGGANHKRAWDYLTGSLRDRGIVVFLSDFLEAEETLPPLLNRMHYARHDCLAIQVLDPDEIDLPFDISTEFIDAEEGRRILTYPEKIRDDYERKMNEFLRTLSASIARTPVDFLRLQTSDSLAESLAAYLNRRDALR